MKRYFSAVITFGIVGSVARASVESQQYCATIDATNSAGASGFVALQVQNGVAKYSFSLDMNNFVNTTQCALSYGLKYHIHSFWNSNTATSAANAQCGASFTGGHYDPNLACSQSSQSHTTLCPPINRTAPGYTYSCNTTNYQEGQYALCEVGDISGKHGIVYPASSYNYQFSVTNFMDYQPPYTYNFLKQDRDSLMWSSFVFHCGQNDNRLVCAKFSATDLSACSSSFATSNSESPTYSAGALAAGILVPSIVLFFLGVFLGSFVLHRKANGPLSSSKELV